MSLKPTMLLVEDRWMTREHLRRLFTSPPNELADTHGLAGFVVTVTGKGAEARNLLETARRTINPYDVMVFDLEVPPGDDPKEANLEVGLSILQDFDERTYGALVIESAYGTNPILIRLLQLGRAYFIPKPFEDEEIFAAAAQAFRSGRQHLETRATSFLAERAERWKLIQSRTQIADYMARTVSEGIGRVIEQADELKRLIQDRWQLYLEQDRDDPVYRTLENLRTAAVQTASECAQARQPVVRDSGALQRIGVEQLVADVLERLRNVIAFRRVKLEWPTSGETKVSSFPADVQGVVEELVCSAVQASGEGQTVEVTVGRSEDGQTVNIAVADEAEAKPDEAANLLRINEGRPVKLDTGRAWGLFLAQHVATNIGSKVQIEPASTGKPGTKSVLQIPLTAND